MSKKPEEHSGEKVPLWIISFADMITLLLSFFVMLQTMSKHQDAKLMGISQEAFRRAINGMGLPDFLFGRQSQLDFQYRQIKYSMEESKTPSLEPSRVIDADDDRIRLLFKQIRDEMNASSTEKPEKLVHLVNAAVVFDPGSSSLDKHDMETLDDMARTFSQDQGGGTRLLTVVCWAGDEPSPREQWLVSARRAKAVERYMQKALAGARWRTWRFSSWGAGAAGSTKSQSTNLAPSNGRKSAIAIVITTAGE